MGHTPRLPAQFGPTPAGPSPGLQFVSGLIGGVSAGLERSRQQKERQRQEKLKLAESERERKAAMQRALVAGRPRRAIVDPEKFAESLRKRRLTPLQKSRDDKFKRLSDAQQGVRDPISGQVTPADPALLARFTSEFNEADRALVLEQSIVGSLSALRNVRGSEVEKAGANILAQAKNGIFKSRKEFDRIFQKELLRLDPEQQRTLSLMIDSLGERGFLSTGIEEEKVTDEVAIPENVKDTIFEQTRPPRRAGVLAGAPTLGQIFPGIR